MKKTMTVAELAPPTPALPTPQEKFAAALRLAEEARELETKQKTTEEAFQTAVRTHDAKLFAGHDNIRDIQRLRSELDSFPEAIRIRRERGNALAKEAIADIQTALTRAAMPKFFEAQADLRRVLEAVGPAWSKFFDFIAENQCSADDSNSQIARVESALASNRLERVAAPGFVVPQLDVPTFQRSGFVAALLLMIDKLA